MLYRYAKAQGQEVAGADDLSAYGGCSQRFRLGKGCSSLGGCNGNLEWVSWQSSAAWR